MLYSHFISCPLAPPAPHTPHPPRSPTLFLPLPSIPSESRTHFPPLHVCSVWAVWLGSDQLWPLAECRRRRWRQAEDDKWANCFRLTVVECLPARLPARLTALSCLDNTPLGGERSAVSPMEHGREHKLIAFWWCFLCNKCISSAEIIIKKILNCGIGAVSSMSLKSFRNKVERFVQGFRRENKVSSKSVGANSHLQTLNYLQSVNYHREAFQTF